MNIRKDAPLKELTTIKIGGKADFLVSIANKEDLIKAVQAIKAKSVPFTIIGGGSNIIAKDEGFRGVIIRNRMSGIEINGTTVKANAGEEWDVVVEQSVEQGLSGIEALSHIPGTAGAAPVQNIGAYGQEIADTLVELEAYDTQNEQFVTLKNTECGFSYRNSIFKSSEKGRYIITSITLELTKTPMQPPFYASLEKYLTENNVTYYDPKTIRDAVIAIRANRLPNPKIHPNAGSFFKNPIVEKWRLDEVEKEYGEIPKYDMGENKFKVPAGWLIEQADMKDYAAHNLKTYQNNSLVIVNDNNATYEDLKNFRAEIMAAVRDKFRIELSQEPIEL